jgi:uncharacterized protein (DUF433 family)
MEPKIVATPGVLGGRPCIEGTRLSVRTVATWYKQGYSPEEIAGELETVSLAQVYAALTYYHAHQAEVEADLATEAAAYDQLLEAHTLQRKSA